MISTVLLSIGGACGAMARYKIGVIILKHSKHTFPLGTLIVNIMGALLLGILCGLNLSKNSYLLFGDGFCGAFTTFSTFAVESVQLIKTKAVKKSIAFISLSITIGLICFWIGYELGNIFLI